MIECTGVDSLVFDAMDHVGPGGVVCLTGVSSGGRTIDIDAGLLNRNMVLENEAVVGSVNANRRHYEAAAAALAKADRSWLATRREPQGAARAVVRRRSQRQPDDVKVVIQVGPEPRLIMSTTVIAPGITQIDTLLGGWARMTAGYLVDGDAPLLVETGSQSSVPVFLEALAELGVSPGELAGVAVTHIHLDHAGGVGDVARAFPSATVYVHEKGARHLVDPDPARRLGQPGLRPASRFSLWAARPDARERIHVLADGEEIRTGADHVLTTVDSPGHAKHHLALHDSASGILFAGDAVGVQLPDAGVLRPATPPPDFDLDQAVNSLHRFAQRHPTGLALAHYGLLGDAGSVLGEAEQTLREWAGVAEQAWKAGRDIASALEESFATDYSGLDSSERSKLETLNGVHSNAAGFRRWLEKRSATGDQEVSV